MLQNLKLREEERRDSPQTFPQKINTSMLQNLKLREEERRNITQTFPQTINFF